MMLFYTVLLMSLPLNAAMTTNTYNSGLAQQTLVLDIDSDGVNSLALQLKREDFLSADSVTSIALDNLAHASVDSLTDGKPGPIMLSDSIDEAPTNSLKSENDSALFLKTGFYKTLPDGYYVAVHLDETGKEIYWQSLGNPFLARLSHSGGEAPEFIEVSSANISLDFSQNPSTTAIKLGVRRGDEIVFLDQTIYVAD